MSLNKYKVFQLCFNTEINQTNVVFKINTENDYDFNLITTMSNELYVKELDKILVINNISSAFFNNDNKNHDFETKIDYIIKEKPKEIVNDTNISEISSIVNNLLNYMEDFKKKVLENENKEDIIEVEEELVQDIEIKEDVVDDKEIKENIIEEKEDVVDDKEVKENIVEEKEDVVDNKEVKENIVEEKEDVVDDKEVKKDVVDDKEEVKEDVVDDKEVKEDIVEECECKPKEKPKYKIKTPDDVKNNFMNKKKPIIETKLLQLLNDSTIINKNIDFNESEGNKNSDIEEKIFYHLKLITLSSMDISTNIVFIVTELMKFIDNYAIKGSEKKSIILSTIKKFLDDENYPNTDYIVNTVCPELIDILISIDKRKIMIKKKVTCFS